MTTTLEKFKRALKKLTLSSSKSDDSANEPSFSKVDKTQQRRLKLEEKTGVSLASISASPFLDDTSSLKGNIENIIGMAQLPIGVTGPLLIKGQHAEGNFHIPLATTEGALVASYTRGAKACSLSGGVKTYYITEGVQRCPIFIFENCGQALDFQNWIEDQFSIFTEITGQSSRYAQLKKVDSLIEGNQIILTFVYTTGDAAGQNMVTICTQAICEYILKNSPAPIKRWYIESNFGGDKKATQKALGTVRGRKVIAEVIIPRSIVAEVLKSTPEAMTRYFQTHLLASIQSGAIGAQGHYANGLTALFLATGQDVACVAEAAIGITRFETTEDGDLYLSVTLPNMIVGTVGGGTHLPTPSTCLDLIDCKGTGKAKKFAEIAAAIVLSGELSINAALAEGHFARAHQKLGRPSGGRRD